MSDALFAVSPAPDGPFGPSGFSIQVLPYPGGVHTTERMQFSDAEAVKKFLWELEKDESLRSIWSGYLADRIAFGIKSTYNEWIRVVNWADEQARH